MGGRRSKLLQVVVNLEPARALFAEGDGAAPEGYSSGTGVSQRAAGVGRTNRRCRGGEPKR